MSRYHWAVERLLEFKTVPARWDCLKVYDSREEAEHAVSIMKPGARAAGGTIKEFRVRDLNI